MKQRILIADPREIVRAGLHALFATDDRVDEIHEATTNTELMFHLHSLPFDLVLVHQELIADLSLLPQENFVLLIKQPDLNTLQTAYIHGAKGYLSENISFELLRTVLCTTNDFFLLDPLFLPWVMSHISNALEYKTKLKPLSPREREILGLLQNGLDRRTIAKQLHISESTLKTHIKNIARKGDT